MSGDFGYFTSTYLVIIQIEQVHFLFSIYSLPKTNHFCVNCKYLQIVIERAHLPC